MWCLTNNKIYRDDPFHDSHVIYFRVKKEECLSMYVLCLMCITSQILVMNIQPCIYS